MKVLPNLNIDNSASGVNLVLHQTCDVFHVIFLHHLSVLKLLYSFELDKIHESESKIFVELPLRQTFQPKLLRNYKKNALNMR